jgi:hypothetical protein
MLDRLYDIWIGDEDAELRNMIADFRIDYGLDRRFMLVLDLIEDAIVNWDYDRALSLFETYAPERMAYIDQNLFTTLLIDAQYGI